MRSILLVDDDAAVLEVLGRFFDGRGWTTLRAMTGAAAIEWFERERPELVLLDLDLPDTSGLPVLGQLRERDPDATVIMLTGHGDIATAVAAMRLGAENFLTKPVELEHLGAAIDRAAEKAELRRRNRFLTARAREDPPEDDALGQSPLMREIHQRLVRVADGDATVLLEGETGTGKGWVARRIHELSARRDAPFVEVSCGGLSPASLESELFGHEPGSAPEEKGFRDGLLEVAHGGTIFLDEVGDLTAELQPKLLQVLETRRFRRPGGSREVAVDVRMIAATHRDLRARVADGGFRDDLYFRLAVLPIRLPPLRERTPEDIAALAYRVLDELRRDHGGGPTRISEAVIGLLVRHTWPGNIRELRNLIERILILSEGADEIGVRHLPPELRRGTAPSANGEPLTLQEVERRHIARMLEANEGNRARTARQLGISRATLYEKLDRYGLRKVGR